MEHHNLIDLLCLSASVALGVGVRDCFRLMYRALRDRRRAG